MLVFVPVARPELAAWAVEGVVGPGAGFAVTPGLMEAFGFTDPTDEEAEYTALQVAGLAGLLAHGCRLIAVAEAGDAQSAAPVDFGGVTLGPLPWSAVRSLFADGDPAAAASVYEGLGAVDLDRAWEDSRVEELLSAGELLWHAPSEWGTLV